MSRNILVVAAHPDDEILGCGATMAKHADQGDKVGVLFIADGVGSRQKQNLPERKKSAENAIKIVGATILDFLDLPDGQLDSMPILNIIQKIEEFVQSFQPEIIYTHHYGDLNIDHAITHRAVMTACRPLPKQKVTSIFSFEVVSSTEWAAETDQFNPNYFVNVEKFWDKKIKALNEYAVEMREFPHARSMKNLDALSVFRGASAGIARAEAFRLVRSVI